MSRHACRNTNTGACPSAGSSPGVDPQDHAAQLDLPHVAEQAVTGRLELALVDRRLTAGAAAKLGRRHGVEVRRVGWDDKQPAFRPIRRPGGVEVAHGRLGRCCQFAKPFENSTTSATGWLQVSCIATTLRHLSQLPARAVGLLRAA